MLVVIRGAGDVASSVALRLHCAGCTHVLLDVAVPTSVRRCVSFSGAIRIGETTIEGVCGVFCKDVAEAMSVAATKNIAVFIDPEGESIAEIKPDAVVDAILAKHNIGTTKALWHPL